MFRSDFRIPQHSPTTVLAWWLGLRLQEGEQFSAPKAEFAANISAMRLHRLDGKIERISDFLVPSARLDDLPRDRFWPDSALTVVSVVRTDPERSLGGLRTQ